VFLFLICGRNGLCEDHNDKSHGFSFFCLILAVPFNAIVLGLGHMRATGDGVGALGLADKMDLVQMMLDCAETMTSVLDNVTDMGINFNTLLSLFFLKSLCFCLH
jgi:hypothetical protein